MAGVYIQGMELPKSPGKYRIEFDSCGNPYLLSDNDDLGLWHLVPVPDHGRLIDADKLRIRDAEKQAYEAYLREKGEDFIEEPIIEYHRGYLEGLTHASGLVRFAPTIIPADKDGDA